MGTTAQKKALTTTITKDYEPRNIGVGFHLGSQAVPFTPAVVPRMLHDPEVTFGLDMLKGPILANAKFRVKATDPAVKDFVATEINRFWQNSADRALSAVEWGFQPAEVIYRMENGFIRFDTLREIHPNDATALTLDGKFVGFKADTEDGEVNVIGQKAFWHVHWRKFNPWYGRSRLFSAYLPWIEKWTDGGYRDSRRLFFYKYAFGGYRMRFPPGVTPDENGIEVPNVDIARRIIEVIKNGGAIAIPQVFDENGNALWVLEEPTIAAEPVGLLEYGNRIDDEILKGIGIPPEVVRAEGTGAFAGRRVPQQAFFATLKGLTQWLMFDYDQHVIRPTVNLNFFTSKYEIEVSGLLRDDETEAPPDKSQPSLSVSGDGRQSRNGSRLELVR